MNIAEQFEKRKTELRNELQLLEQNNLQALFEEKASLEAKLAEVTLKISTACNALGINLPSGTGSKPARLKKGELIGRDLMLLTENPGGLSQKQISVKTGAPYPSVVVCLKANEDKIRSTGERKDKRYFSKEAAPAA